MNVMILTEANEQVASGHLLECIELSRELERNGDNVLFLINADMQAELKKRIGAGYEEIAWPLEEQIHKLASMVHSNSIDIIVTNFRRVEDDFINILRDTICLLNGEVCPKIVCIDELGKRRLSADVIINPMIDPFYWDYPESQGLLFCGQEYLVLSRELCAYHAAPKTISQTIKNITVSMGGVDKPGTTLKLVRWLPNIFPDAQIRLVCGGGFSMMKELSDLVSKAENVLLYRNIDFLYRLFYQSDIAICAGGNTLHELAAIGVPTIVIPSMPHELRNGKCFASLGYGVVVEKGCRLDLNDLLWAVDHVQDESVRLSMSMAGKKIATGRGAALVSDILRRLCKGDVADLLDSGSK